MILSPIFFFHISRPETATTLSQIIISSDVQEFKQKGTEGRQRDQLVITRLH